MPCYMLSPTLLPLFAMNCHQLLVIFIFSFYIIVQELIIHVQLTCHHESSFSDLPWTHWFIHATTDQLLVIFYIYFYNCLFQIFNTHKINLDNTLSHPNILPPTRLGIWRSTERFFISRTYLTGDHDFDTSNMTGIK